MYRFTPSVQTVSRCPGATLSGLIGLGAITSYYRLPTYSCVDSVALKQAKDKCSAGYGQSGDIKYRTGKFSNTKTSPYHVTLADMTKNVFDSCKVSKLKACPIVIDEPLTPIAIPVHMVPSKPPAEQKPNPPVVVIEEPLTPIPIPVHMVPSKPPAEQIPNEPVTSWTTPSAEEEQVVKQAETAFTSLPTKSKAGVQVTKAEPEEEEGVKTELIVGGVLLLLVAGGGLTYYLTRKKRR